MSGSTSYRDSIRLSYDEGERGWIAYVEDVPIGLISEDGNVATPSGARYTISSTDSGINLRAAGEETIAVYRKDTHPVIRDYQSGVAWELKPDWLETAIADMPFIVLETIFAVPYSLEEAQSTVPARVKLLLAHTVTNAWTRGAPPNSTGGGIEMTTEQDTRTGQTNAQVIKDDMQYIIGTYGRIPVAFERGEGVYLWDVEGNRYLDMVSGGRAGGGLGHCHPKLVAAIREQAGKLGYVSNDYYSPVRSELAKRLSEMTHGYQAFFCNSGGEATEGAIKLARKWAKTAKGEDAVEILTAYQSFHGRTYGAMSATGQDKFKIGFEPVVPGFRHMRFMDRQVLVQNMPESTCAVMLEPVQGESGVHPASKEYMQDVRRLTQEKNVLLIMDEVQTGFGRTGTFWAYEQFGIQPDIVTLAKSLGGGLPMGVILARPDVAEALGPGTHGSTFGGNPLACAAALAALDALEEDGLMANAAAMGDYFKRGLAAIKREGKPIKEVRGMGLMIGVHLTAPVAGKVQKACHEAGLLIHTVGDNVLRILPALIVTKEQIDQALAILGDALAQ